MAMHVWRLVEETDYSSTERMSVPSGWLYRVTTIVPQGNKDPLVIVQTLFVPSGVLG